MSEGTIHPLKHPVTVTLKSSAGEREETISFLTLRRMKAKDMRLADKIGGDVSTSIEMIAKLSGQPVAVIDELDAEDFTAIGAIIEGFTAPGQKTGESS